MNYKKFILDPSFWRIVLELSPGIRNIILYLLKIKKIYSPYIPVPGLRQIIHFFEEDPILSRNFSKYLKEPYKHINYLKKVYLLLNYSGNFEEIKKNIKELPDDYLLNKAMENIQELGIALIKFSSYEKKFKSFSRWEFKEFVNQLGNLKKNSDQLKLLWENYQD